MFEARWKDNPNICCSSNTIKGAISCLVCFVPEDEQGFIYIYKEGKFIKKYQLK